MTDPTPSAAPVWPMWDETHRHLETLNQYLARMAEAGHTEFRVSIQSTEPVTVPGTRHPTTGESQTGHDVRFLIHPLDRDGDTADFVAPHGGKPQTSPGMTSYEVEPLGHGGLTFEEWAAKVREVSRHDEEDGNLYDFFGQGYAVSEMPAILAKRAAQDLYDYLTGD